MYTLLMEFPELTARFSILYGSDPIFHQQVNLYHLLDQQIRLLCLSHQQYELPRLTAERMFLREAVYRRLIAPELILIASPQHQNERNQQSKDTENIQRPLAERGIRCNA